MNRIRTRLIAVFLAATLVPLAATWWIATALLEHSVAFSSVDQLDRVSKTLEITARELYQTERETLRSAAASGKAPAQGYAAGARGGWPAEVRQFWDSGELERFSLAEGDGSLMRYFVRQPGGVRVFTRRTGLDFSSVSAQLRRARERVAESRGRDLRRGLVTTFAVLAAAVWGVSLIALVFIAHRFSRPLQRLTTGLARLAAGDLGTRVQPAGRDESGRAIQAFNEMAAQLQQSRERMVYLAQVASWRMLARKMAHELKNSLTPIRLTMEEVLARRSDNDQQFLEQAARIVVDEVEGLERRVRAFSEFSAEPPVRATRVDVNAQIEERITLLQSGHPNLHYATRLADPAPQAQIDEDLLKGILTNLMENAADAAGESGTVLIKTAAEANRITIEVHDSGPGLSEQARQSLFEPAISFKKRGMGLGLSIARKNALLSGGEIELIEGGLEGAAFRVSLPVAARQTATAAHPAPELIADS